LAGERIARTTEPVYVASRFYQNYALEFLDYTQADRIHLLDPAQLPSAAEGCLFVLDTGKNGVLELLREAYPQGQVEQAMGDISWPLVYFYKVPPGQGPATTLQGHGLRGVYYRSLAFEGTPAIRRLDPVVNFTFRNDFAVTDFPPLSAIWTGELLAPATGTYQFLAVVTDHARLKVDGRVVFDGRPPEGETRLSKGAHRIELIFKKGLYETREEGQAAALSLAWKKPGTEKFEVVPASALRPGPGR
jgi:hypothetical protein